MKEPAGSLQEPANEETVVGSVDEQDGGQSPSGEIYKESDTQGIKKTIKTLN